MSLKTINIIRTNGNNYLTRSPFRFLQMPERNACQSSLGNIGTLICMPVPITTLIIYGGFLVGFHRPYDSKQNIKVYVLGYW